MASLLTSEQVNYLIWRYLQESGFRESAYAFQRDSHAHLLERIYRSVIKPRTLVHLVQQGLHYEELLSLVDHDGTLRERKLPFRFFASEIEGDDAGVAVGTDDHPTEEEREIEVMSSASESAAPASAPMSVAKRNTAEDVSNAVTRKRRKTVTDGVGGYVSMPSASPLNKTEDLPVNNRESVRTAVEDVVVISATDHPLMLSRAENDAIMTCAWNPIIPTMLATSCAALQIWTLPKDASSPGEPEKIVIPYEQAVGNMPPNATIIKWSYQGDRLASGFYDGRTRIWSTTGVLLNTLCGHSTPIVSCKWNKAGTYVCVISDDGKTIVWDTVTGDPHRAFKRPPLNEVLDESEWISNRRLVGGGDKGNIYLYDIGKKTPVKSWPVHDGKTSCLAWDELTETIATGGTDSTILVWHKPQMETIPENKLEGHAAPIESIVWQQRAGSSRNSGRPILASASKDHTIRLWDVETMSCLRVLNLDLDPGECMCFSRDGTTLASAGDGAVVLWDTETGSKSHFYDRVESQSPPDSPTERNITRIIGTLVWDESGQRLAFGETGYGCTVMTVEPR